MATLTVGVGQQFSTIAAAVAASGSGDTIDVQAGTYTNDFVTISHDLTLNAVGGTVTMVATEQPPDGKAIIDEGGSGVTVSITGFDMSGASVPDGNGAAIRYEGGDLTMTNDTIHDNQEGILSAADPNGNITIDSSTFANNGSGTGFTHNIYIGDIASLTVENSTISGAVGGHDIKSRALANTIENNTITDGPNGTASYEIDLPNGGAATITGNVIEKGPNATNPNGISFGEEGNVYANSSLTVADNTMLNDDTAHSTTAVVNDTDATANISGNTLYGWTNVSSGPASASGNTIPAAEPSLSSLTPGGGSETGPTDTSTTTGTAPTDTSPAAGSAGTGPTGAPDPASGAATSPPDTSGTMGTTGDAGTGSGSTSTSPSPTSTGNDPAVCGASLHHASSPKFISHVSSSGGDSDPATTSSTSPRSWAALVKAAVGSHSIHGLEQIGAMWMADASPAASADPHTAAGGGHTLIDTFTQHAMQHMPHATG